MPHAVECRTEPFLVVIAQQRVDAVRGFFHLAQDGGALVRQARQRRAAQRQPRQATGAGGHSRLRHPLIVQLHMGQAGDTLVAQHGEGARGNGGLVVDGDADQHVARNLGVKTNARDLANGYALVAHGGLWLQAGNAVLAGQLVVLVTGVVAGEPDRQTRQHGGHRQHEDASCKGVGFVFHQDSLAVTALCTGAMARWPRSPRKKCSMNG